MSSEIETALRTSLREASEHLTPHPDLANVVRRATRRRRVRLAVAGSLVAALFASAGGYAIAGPGPRSTGRPGSAVTHHARRALARPSLAIALPAGAVVQSLAVAGNDLYVSTDHSGNPPYELSAYDRVTGALIRQVAVPSMPSALRTGPGGSVWLTFLAAHSSGPSGIWLFSADLSVRSAATFGTADLFPIGPHTALLGWENKLRKLWMPPLGTSGRAAVRADPGWRVRGRFAVDDMAVVAGHVVARVSSDFTSPRLVVADRPALTFGGGRWGYVEWVTAQDDGLWVTTRPSSYYFGPLVRLSPSLRPVTPAWIRATPALSRTEQVWSDGSTVWASTSTADYPLACLRYPGTAGPLISVRVPGQPGALAATRDVVYVSFAPDQVGVPSGIRAYPVPAACR